MCPNYQLLFLEFAGADRDGFDLAGHTGVQGETLDALDWDTSGNLFLTGVSIESFLAGHTPADSPSSPPVEQHWKTSR